WGSPADFVKQWLAQIIFLAVAVIGIAKVVRLNLLGYFLVLALPTLVMGAQELLSQPSGFYRQQGYLVMALLVMLLVWPLAQWMRSRPATSATASVPG
ncbi:MAG TPA: hypothetical protein VFR42_10330, partial [Candidatus Acidoferrum sp.]|nr:hypothetical protein [Candidatus Acidoferrum sp.]